MPKNANCVRAVKNEKGLQLISSSCESSQVMPHVISDLVAMMHYDQICWFREKLTDLSPVLPEISGRERLWKASALEREHSADRWSLKPQTVCLKIRSLSWRVFGNERISDDFSKRGSTSLSRFKLKNKALTLVMIAVSPFACNNSACVRSSRALPAFWFPMQAQPLS